MSRLVHTLVQLLIAFVFASMTAQAEDRALIVGINAYPHFPKSQLTGAVNDAKAIAKLASDIWAFKPSQIKVLLDSEATSQAIRDYLQSWLIDGTEPGDRVLFYYSGHGYYTFAPDQPPEEAWRETIAPYDVRPSAQGGTIDNMIVDLDIKERLDKLKDRTVMFIADACHSGTLWRNIDGDTSGRPSIVRSLTYESMPPPVYRSMRASDLDARRTQRVFLKPADHLIAWSAVQSTELAEEDMSLAAPDRHGVFTRRFIEGLREKRADRNNDGAVSVMELYGYVSEKAAQYCAEHLCRSGRMTPMMEAPSRLIGMDLLAWRPPGANAALAEQPQRPHPSVAHLLPAANTAGLRLELIPSASMRVGQSSKVRLTSPRAGWLILLDVRDDGRVAQLFPSTCAVPDRFVRAGATLTIPDPRYGCSFAASESGSGQIVAIISEDNVSLDSLLARYRDLAAVPDPDAYLSELAQRLMQRWHGEDRTRPSRWSLVSTTYKIER